jgi:hypothetical protein
MTDEDPDAVRTEPAEHDSRAAIESARRQMQRLVDERTSSAAAIRAEAAGLRYEARQSSTQEPDAYPRTVASIPFQNAVAEIEEAERNVLDREGELLRLLAGGHDPNQIEPTADPTGPLPIVGGSEAGPLGRKRRFRFSEARSSSGHRGDLQRVGYLVGLVVMVVVLGASFLVSV